MQNEKVRIEFVYKKIGFVNLKKNGYFLFGRIFCYPLYFVFIFEIVQLQHA
jgi:hypothetical protein